MRKKRTPQAMVLAAGGGGTRIAEYFASIGFSGTKLAWPVLTKPFLQQVIENVDAVGLDQLYILARENSAEVENILAQSTVVNCKITVPKFDHGDSSIVREILSLRSMLGDHSFLYADGNVIYPKSLLTALSMHRPDREEVASLVVSPRDYAPTHLRVALDMDGSIQQVGSRLRAGAEVSVDQEHVSNMFSLGLMRFEPQIFSYLERHPEIRDLDFIIEEIFNNAENGKNLLNLLIYTGEWATIHTSDDLQDLERKFKVISATAEGYGIKDPSYQ